MNYGDYGLDVVKKSKDDDQVQKSYWCMWCDDKHVTKPSFNLCFSNTVICESCLDSCVDDQNIDRWEETDYCFKCKKPAKKAFKTHSSLYTVLHLCDCCIDWGKEVLSNQENYYNAMVQEVLKQCKVEGLIVKLPAEQLQREQYMAVKKRLELIGGKWKGGKTQGFVFEEDPTELLEAIANGDDRNLKKEHQFFATPKDIAQQIISYLPPNISPDAKVLEPSAGDGALIKAFTNVYPAMHVDCYETMDLNRRKLNGLVSARLIGEDFLLCDRKDYYDIIIANPPFSKNQDIEHIKKMFDVLKPGGTLISLASTSWTFGSQKKQIEFKNWIESLDVFPLALPQKSFASSGTGITPVLIQIKKPVIDVSDSEQTSEKNIHEKESLVRSCRVCGCNDNDCSQCIAKTGHPCHWVEQDLCSACVVKEPNKVISELVAINKEIDAGIQDLQKTISQSNINDMNFFTRLNAIAPGIDLNIQIKEKNGKITTSIVPNIGSKTFIQPLNTIGTPEELDEKFFDLISKPVQETVATLSNAEAHKKSVSDSVAASSNDKKSAAPARQQSKTKDAKNKAAAKKAEPKKTVEKPKPVDQPSEPDLFAAPEATTEDQVKSDVPAATQEQSGPTVQS